MAKIIRRAIPIGAIGEFITPERRTQRKEFVPWLKSGGDEIANQMVCFFDIQPFFMLNVVNSTILYGKWPISNKLVTAINDL